MSDWAEKKAREIVDIYRPFFRDDAIVHADGMIKVLAGELRTVEGRIRREAVAAGQDLMVALQRLSGELA